MRAVLLLAALAAAATLQACATAEPMTGARDTARSEQLSRGRANRSPYGLFLAGEAALNAGKAREAAALFARARAGSPDNEVLRSRAFTAALTSGEIKRAAALASELETGAGAAFGLGRLARAVDALADGRGADARTVLNAVQLEPPHGLAAEILKPWTAAAAGDLNSALDARPSSAARPEGEVDASALAQSLNQLGRLDLLERAARFPEADALVASLIGPEAPPRQLLKAGAYLERRGRPEQAAALYTRAIAERGATPALTAALARVQARRSPPQTTSLRAGAAEALIIPAVAFAGGRQYETALAYLRMALHLDPRFDDAQVMLGDVLAASGDTEGARRAYAVPKPGSDSYAAARARLALALQEAGRKSEAVDTIRVAAAAAPTDSSVLTAYAALLSQENRHSEAADVFDAPLVTETGRADWRLWYLRGSARERAGRWAEAERDLQEAMRLAPEEPEVLNALGYSWVDRGLRLREALGMLEKAARLRPRSGAIVDSLGWAHYRLGNFADAVRELERAAELEPGDPTINDHLGDAYWRIGRRVEAQFQWTRALSLEPEPPLRADVTAKLASPAGPDVVRPAAQAQTQP